MREPASNLLTTRIGRAALAILDGVLLVWLWIFVAPAMIVLAIVTSLFAAADALLKLNFLANARRSLT